MTSTQAVGKVRGCSTRRRRATPARSIRSPPASCRSRSARRPRPSPTPSTERRPIASPCDGAPRPIPTTRKARSSNAATQRPTRDAIEALLPSFIGEIMQMPPRVLRDQDRRPARLRSRARRRDRRARGAPRADRPARISSTCPTLHLGVRGRMRPRHLCPRHRPRHRPDARLLRPCHRAAPHARRSVPGGAGGHARANSRTPPASTTAASRSRPCSVQSRARSPNCWR